MVTSVESMAQRQKLLLRLLLGTLVARYAFNLLYHVLNDIQTTAAWLSPVDGNGWTSPPPIGFIVTEILVLCVSAALLANFAFWVSYRAKLRSQPGVREAVNDEFAQHNWLLAFRFSGICLAAFYLINWISRFAIQITETLLRNPSLTFRGPQVILSALGSLYVPVALISFIGSFLFYGRDR
jgi:hypothetical protein